MFVRSVLFNIAFWLWIGVIGIVGLPFTLIYWPSAFLVGKLFGHGSIWLLKNICSITYQVKGRENIPKGGALIASKHQSAWDTIIFWVLTKRPAYVLKRELIFLPIFGWYLLLLRNIYINRKSGASAMKRMLREAEKCLEDGRQIIIFPEGTRTSPGSTSIYHPGIAALYQHLKVPVVPVALNSGYLWPRNAFTKKSGVITIEFLENITPGFKNREFLAKLQNTIEEATQKL